MVVHVRNHDVIVLQKLQAILVDYIDVLEKFYHYSSDDAYLKDVRDLCSKVVLWENDAFRDSCVNVVFHNLDGLPF